MQGAAILFYPTAIGWHPFEKHEHGKAQFDSWLAVQKGHAVANGVYVAAVNRIGLEKTEENSAGIEFWGQSFVCDPQGIVIAQASADKEEILLAEIDLDRIEYIRQNWPFLRDRRIDSYDGITKRFLDEYDESVFRVAFTTVQYCSADGGERYCRSRFQTWF